MSAILEAGVMIILEGFKIVPIAFSNKIGTLISLPFRFKRRHLRLGFHGILQLAKWHLASSNMQFESNLESSWAIFEPSISVLITVYNQDPDEINRAIDSARNQEIKNLKVLILDDGSTSPETTRFLDELKLFSNELLFRRKNVGVVLARNYLIEQCGTDYLVFLDPDDSFLPSYLQEALKLLIHNREIEIIYPNVMILDESNAQYSEWGTGPFDEKILRLTNTIPMSSVISTKFIKMLGGFSLAFSSGVEDWDLWYRAALSKAKASHLPIFGYQYTKKITSRTTRATDNSDLIQNRAHGPFSYFPFEKKMKMQIFLFIPFLLHIGGVETYVRSTAKFLTSIGYEVIVVLSESHPFGYQDASSEFRSKGYFVICRVDYGSDEEFINALKTLAAANSLAINYGSPWVFQNIRLINSIFDRNIGFVFNEEISLERVINNKQYFDEIWAAFEGISELIQKKTNKVVRTIYTGILDPSPKIKKNTKKEVVTVGFLGRLSVEKNPFLFIEIAKLLQNNRKFRFVIAGDGPIVDQVEHSIKRIPNIEYLGCTENSEEFLEKIDILMITSDVEGIPLVAMESLDVGTPVVSTNVGGMSELIQVKDNGMTWDGDAYGGVEALQVMYAKLQTGNLMIGLDSNFGKIVNFDKIKQALLDLGLSPSQEV